MLDLILIAIILLCAWRGFKSGLVNGIIGILAVILAVYLAGLASQVYSNEFAGLLEPFATGVVDGKMNDIIAWNDGDEEIEGKKKPEFILTSDEKRDVYTVSRAVVMSLGISEGPADDIAASTAQIEHRVSQ